MDSEISTPVLLVCIYNKYGNVITHDYFYQMFGQYGEIVKILIFQKAKVWKTFVQFTNPMSAYNAKINLDGHVVFEDGSKMNIFPSKLKHIKLQNTNLGGVNYEDLKTEQQEIEDNFVGIRNRRSTFQDHTKTNDLQPYVFMAKSEQNQSSNCQKQSTFSLQDSETYSNKKSVKSFNAFDIDEQFRQIARESIQFRQMEKQAQEEEFRTTIRRKAKTIVNNPNIDQFVFENSPSRVLFVRSIPQNYTNKCLYNIFSNFGTVMRIIFMKEKLSGLVQFQNIESAIYAKDQINYLKPQIKIFYSHYETLTLRKQIEGEELLDYKSNASSVRSKNHLNPPSSVLYMTVATPNQEEQIREQFAKLECEAGEMQWKQNGKDKWMCLVCFLSIDQSLLVMGLLQDFLLSNGKQLKFAFTRSKLSKSKKQFQ